MRIVELLLWLMVALAVVMKLLHLPLASFFLIVSLSSIALLYWWFGWLVFPSPTRKDQHVGITILASFALNFLCIGILFKVQAWPMASFQALAGVGLGSLAMLLAWLHAKHKQERKPFAMNIIARVAPLSVAVLLLLPVSARSMMRFHHRGESPQKLELYDRMYSTQDLAEKERIWQQLDSLEETEVRARAE